MIADDEARKLAEEIVLYATTKPRSNDYTEEEFTLSQAVLSLSIELTEWKIRCAELEQNAEHIQSSDEAEDLKRALTDCSIELAELRQVKEDADYYKRRLEEIIPLFQEARDALTAITVVQMKLHNISPSLADRMDVAGTRKKP